jgi:Co/Zn/Cd efflux system component
MTSRELTITEQFVRSFCLAEVIGAFTSVLMIWVVTGILVYMAFERVMSQEFEINAEVMLITSAVGVAVNIL